MKSLILCLLLAATCLAGEIRICEIPFETVAELQKAVNDTLAVVEYREDPKVVNIIRCPLGPVQIVQWPEYDVVTDSMRSKGIVEVYKSGLAILQWQEVEK